MSTKHQAEEAEHVGHSNKHAALLIAVLAAALAVCEQQAKHAEVELTEKAVLAADTWNEYQAKSIRATNAHDLASVVSSFEDPATSDRLALRQKVLVRLAEDEKHYNSDPKTGKEVLAEHAKRYEEERTAAMERSHSLDNAAAALDLGIVLATASVITSAGALLLFAYLMGTIGVVLGVGSLIAPAMFVF
jgi:Domain of unknown function (DUF4337)